MLEAYRCRAGQSYSRHPEGRLVNEHVAAEMLGRSVHTLRHWRWVARGPRFLKLGRAVRYELRLPSQHQRPWSRRRLMSDHRNRIGTNEEPVSLPSAEQVRYA